MKIKIDHINFFLQEVEKSRRQIPESTCVDGYMKFASTNYMMIHYLCQQHALISILWFPNKNSSSNVSRKEELKKCESIGKEKGKGVKKSMEKRRKKEIKLVIFDKDGTLVPVQQRDCRFHRAGRCNRVGIYNIYTL